MRMALATLFLMLLPTAALADRKAGDACATGLPPEAKDIYTTTIAKSPPPGQARAVVVAEAERLMKTGDLTMMQARTAAEAAGKCLELIEK